MEDAFLLAKARTKESAADDTESGTTVSDDAASEQSTTKAPDGPEKTRAFDERGALQRILTLKQQGRLGELPPEARGVLKRLEDDIRTQAISIHREEEQREAEFKDLFLTNLALKETDPAAYVRLMDDRPELSIFMDSYKKAHPEVTLDDPDARPRKSEEQLRSEIANTYAQGFEGFIDAVAEDGGLDPEAYKKLKSEFQFGKHPDSGNLTTFGAKLITSLAESMAEELAKKQVEKVKADEKKAYDLQLQKIRGEAAQTPRQLSGGVSKPGSAGRTSGPISMADALAEAKELIASR